MTDAKRKRKRTHNYNGMQCLIAKQDKKEGNRKVNELEHMKMSIQGKRKKGGKEYRSEI